MEKNNEIYNAFGKKIKSCENFSKRTVDIFPPQTKP